MKLQVLVAIAACFVAVFAFPGHVWASDVCASEEGVGDSSALSIEADGVELLPEGVLVLCDDPFLVDEAISSDAAGEQLGFDDGSCAGQPQTAYSDHGETCESGICDEVSQPSAPALDVESPTAQDCSESQRLTEDISADTCDDSLQDTADDSFDTSNPEHEEAPTGCKEASHVGEGTTSSGGAAEGISEASMSASSGERVVVVDEELYRHEQNAVVVRVAPGTTRDQLAERVRLAGSFDVSEVSDEDLSYGVVRLVIADGATVRAAIERLNLVEGLFGAQPNYVYYPVGYDGEEDELEDGEEEDFDVEEEVPEYEYESSNTSVNDYWASRQWALYSTYAYAAWDVVQTCGSVGVAVIDTGADLDHPDLAPNIVATHNAFVSNHTVEDQVGHGTHVAGLIAGVANNKIGVAGVSYNAKLVIIKASPYKSSGFDSAALVRAYAWLGTRDESGKTVAEHYNVRVVNLSVSGWDDTRSSNLPDDVLNLAMTRARDELGLLTVVAAGNKQPNEAPYAAYPTDSEACLSVMNICESYDDDGIPIGYELDLTSNYNTPGFRYKDICAPGTDVYSTWLNGKYASDSGTSMAAPIVAGIASMLFAVNPYLTPQAAMSILETTATDLGEEGWDEVYGYGMVNAAEAVRLATTSRLDGWDAVGLYDVVGFTPVLGPGLVNETGAWTWSVYGGTGSASIDANGVLSGNAPGVVTVSATCTTKDGASISALRKVWVVDSEIVGEDTVEVGGSSSSTYSVVDDAWTWTWKVEDGTGSAFIDQDAILVGKKAGTVYVTATCSSNTDIILRKEVKVLAAVEAQSLGGGEDLPEDVPIAA